jgi:hypothetical protein
MTLSLQYCRKDHNTLEVLSEDNLVLAYIIRHAIFGQISVKGVASNVSDNDAAEINYVAQSIAKVV